MGIVLVNLDTVLQLIVEGLLLRVVSEEQRLQSVYRDGNVTCMRPISYLCTLSTRPVDIPCNTTY